MNYYTYKKTRYTTKQLSELPECKVSYSQLYWRLTRTEMSVNEAVNTPVKNVRYYDFLGETVRMCVIMKHPKTAVTENTVRLRINAGWSAEDAAFTPVLRAPKKPKKPQPIKQNREKLRQIMSVPVNPEKDVYLKMSQGYRVIA